MSFVEYFTPNGESVNNVRARITATGVALLAAFVVNWFFQAIGTFACYRNSSEEDKTRGLMRLLETTRVIYLYAVCGKIFTYFEVIFSVYPPFFQGLAHTLMAWITFLLLLLMHAFCFCEPKIAERSLWSYFYTLYHISLVIWFILIMAFSYTWMSQSES